MWIVGYKLPQALIDNQSDPTPFKYIASERSNNAIFIDLDFPELIAKKTNMIVASERLKEIIKLSTNPVDEIWTKHYIAAGCNLRDLKRLDNILCKSSVASNPVLDLDEPFKSNCMHYW
ncbi:tRNA wybutosine-synthesizing protein 4 [Neolecta irregularis DAH-3]|uniref:tRNA wybutosine-synthesizing protein 4 n=1 Tax=Neolecta irregularis (strain DAH-3) TaxID=1198029 RepID=A0A1U7LL06_NEOID|nr:tRNA wybutosine-synthesizing protein 4 [Neolecta irregularis DAH-3]|eukprot:OLL23346.1 tRNA wybutosine-synthesizing protein 4 [Neolecta irregularis DAH-3]